jgi:hypothetical protein
MLRERGSEESGRWEKMYLIVTRALISLLIVGYVAIDYPDVSVATTVSETLAAALDGALLKSKQQNLQAGLKNSIVVAGVHGRQVRK